MPLSYLANRTVEDGSWCEQRAIAYQGVPVGTIKHFITGKGNSNKQAVIEAVRARGFRPADDNEADAIAILLWAAGKFARQRLRNICG